MATTIVVLTGMGARAGLFERQSEARETALIELYSSEGCNSCPPAEAWFSRLKTDARLWAEFVPVSFHVDYWDYLGWTDRFARPQFTARQYDYRRAWKSKSVYTPELALDGREWKSWGNLPSRPTPRPGVLKLSETTPGNFTASFAPEDATNGKWSFHIAILGCGLSSEITAGENSGRTLVHDFVALAFEQKAAEGNETKFVLTPPKIKALQKLALALWVSRVGDETPVQALGGWWNP